MLFMALYRHANRLSDALLLTTYETYQNKTAILANWVVVTVCLSNVLVVYVAQGHGVPFTGFVYALIWPSIIWLEKSRRLQWQSQQKAHIEDSDNG